MKNRLRRNERESIKILCKTNPLYLVLQNPCRTLEKELVHVRLTSEEVFLEVMTILDYVKENVYEASFNLQGLWNSLYCDLREMDINDSDKDELTLATSEIVYGTMLAASLLDGIWYTKLTMSLMEQITCNCDYYHRLKELFMPGVWRYGEEKLKEYLQDYMDGEVWISDEINESISALPKMELTQKDETESTKTQKQLTNRQLIILFDYFLNVPLTSGYTNINALAKFLSMVSGKSPGSIRGKIIEGVDYDTKSVKEDVQNIADLLVAIDPQLAEKFKKSSE